MYLERGRKGFKVDKKDIDDLSDIYKDVYKRQIQLTVHLTIRVKMLCQHVLLDVLDVCYVQSSVSLVLLQ